MRLLLAFVVGACIGCSSSAATHSRPPHGCSVENDPVDVATTFVKAVEANDTAAYERCEHPGTLVNEDLIRATAAGGLLLDDLAIENRYLPPPASNEVVYRIPAPHVPDTFRGMPHQNGIHITVTLEPDGLDYVTEVRVYAST